MAAYHLHAGTSAATLTLSVQQLLGSGVCDVNSRSYTREPTPPLSVPQRESSTSVARVIFKPPGSGATEALQAEKAAPDSESVSIPVRASFWPF